MLANGASPSVVGGHAPDEIGGDDAALPAVDGDLEFFGPEVGDGQAVAIDDLDVDGDQVDGGAEGRLLRAGHRPA